jgi:CheY-like chemotaxis protein
VSIVNPADDNPLQAFIPLRVLVVDDDALITEVVVDHYRALGFAVDSAANGAEALKKMELELPDLVLCDRKMPEMSGPELLEIIRGRGPEWQKMAFVFVTALNDRRDRYAMMPLHPDGYLCKPIDFAKEDRLLASILKTKRQPPAA